MGRKLTYALAIVSAIGVIFAMGPDEVQRPLADVVSSPIPEGAGILVVDLVDGATEADLTLVEGLLGADLDWTHPLSVDEALAEGWVTDLDEAVMQLAGNPLVEVVEPAIQLEAYGFPNDPMYEKQWNMKAMGAPEGWANTSRGEGVIVAVIDTGVTKVEDLEGTTVLTGATFVPGTSSSADDQGHGTHVAGTIAQTTNNGKGVAGVAPEATILPVKVLSKWGFGSSSWIASGIDYAADNGADVINLSLGGGYSSVIHNAIKKARKKGVIVIAAAGNSGKRGVGYPGALEETIGVSATGPDGKRSFYSSYGKGVDIAAPGGDKRKAGGGILQNTIDGNGGHVYAEFQGTSMATPHVVGAAAILLSRGAPADQVERILLESARGDGTWNEEYGHGQLDLASAMAQVGGSSGVMKFFLGALFAFLVTQLASTGRVFQVASAGWAGVTAGGLFFLAYLPLPDFLLIELVTRGLLDWPAVILGSDWMHFPLWLSCLIPLAAAFTLGAFRGSRAVALGVTAGMAAAMFHGAATGGLEPWWMPASVGSAWLGLNASICVLLSLGLAGAEKLEEEEARR
jgi:serine protease